MTLRRSLSVSFVTSAYEIYDHSKRERKKGGSVGREGREGKVVVPVGRRKQPSQERGNDVRLQSEVYSVSSSVAITMARHQRMEPGFDTGPSGWGCRQRWTGSLLLLLLASPSSAEEVMVARPSAGPGSFDLSLQAGTEAQLLQARIMYSEIAETFSSFRVRFILY